jgi:hypothetical protein
MYFSRLIRRVAFLLLPIALSACISPKSFVDPALGEIKTSDFAKPAKQESVQLLVEFQTKGSPNARATEMLRPKVLEQVSQSGLFNQVSYEPAASKRTLSFVINNVALTDSVAAKGFGVGLTFGLVGTMVSDGYVCKVILTEPGKPQIAREVKHALHTTIGNKEGPPGLSAMAPVDAANIVIRQMIAASLKQVSDDPGFGK